MSKEIKDIMTPIRIRYGGVYSWKAIYSLVRNWLDERRYDFMEPKYKDKVSSPLGNEVEVDMIAELAITEYIMFHIDISFHLYDVKEFEADIDGQKQLVTNGRMNIELMGWVEIDYSGRFNTPFEEKLLDFLLNVALKKYFEFKYFDKLTYEVYDLETQIKKNLKMQTKYNAF